MKNRFLLCLRIFLACIVFSVGLFAVLPRAQAQSSQQGKTAEQWHEEARTHYAQGHYELAVAFYTKAIEANPSEGVYWRNRALAYNVLGKYDLAIADATKAIALKPDFAEAYSARGHAYAGQSKYDQAIDDLTESIRLKGDNAMSYLVRSQVYDNMGEFGKAIADITKAIELAPDNAMPYNSRGWIFLRVGDDAKGLADAQKAVELEPRSSYYDTRAWAYFFLGDLDKAEADALSASRLDPDYQWHKALLFRVGAARGNTAAAVAQAEKDIQMLAEDETVRPVLEYFLDRRSIEDLKSNYPEQWSNYDVAVRGWETSEPAGARAAAPAVSRPAFARYWAIVVGVSSYADSRVPVLRYASRDARGFYDWLVSQGGGKHAPADVQLLLDKKATAKNIRDALFNWSKQALPEDILTIYLACHGSPESPDSPENLFLLPYDVDYSNISATAFPMWDIKTALERFVKAGRVVIIADVCHSGGIGEPFTVARRGVAGIAPSMLHKGVSGLAEVREGVLVFTSTQGGQLSQEGARWGGGHGIFTYYLLDGLKGAADYDNNGSVTLGELVPYVQEKVRRETRDAQTPQASGRYDTNLSIAR
ncbi:MAG: tetratricopeptide repeat protein [Planctomycetes bacterium]|nr:tetratricopeptide repeat protein [Planctomycetota bacterium]